MGRTVPLYPKYGGSIFLQSVGKYIPGYLVDTLFIFTAVRM
jgi:hypothetical protein